MMEFGLREWLFILGPVFIVGVLAHGYWRMFSNRHRLKMSLDKTYVTKTGQGVAGDEDIVLLRAELPNGGARVRTIPEQTSLDLNQEVPVLMESVHSSEHSSEHGSEHGSEPPSLQSTAKKTTEGAGEGDRVEDLATDSLVSEPIIALRDEKIDSTPSIKATKKKSTKKTATKTEPKELPEKFIVIYVIALNEPFSGQTLLENLVEQGLSYGEMDIFHKLDTHNFSKFSLVNAVEPGTFDLNVMGDMETPGISLFMRVHELNDPVGIFNEMIDLAQILAQELGGEVRDESRSAMTHQTIEHARLGISEYLLKNRQ